MSKSWIKAIASAVALGGLLGAAFVVGASTILHHVHGLAFTPDGKALVVPAHYGLAVYRDGRWTKAPGPPHDLMGFSMTRGAIYSSGHPAAGTPLRDPLGLVKSTDGGLSWRLLGLSGEADFHLMAAGYRSGAIYVINPARNSRMPSPGLYVTHDEGRSWKAAAASGVAGRVTSIAAHPTSPAIIALGTLRGLHLSRDGGAAFSRLGPPQPVTAVTFDPDGKHIYFATQSSDRLYRIGVDGTQSPPVPLPALGRDFVLYIAQNPAARNELAIATARRDVYLSADGGNDWQQIADEGKAAAPAEREAALRRSGGK
jgi:DNA-binding beta-propeller fold protein YncE